MDIILFVYKKIVKGGFRGTFKFAVSYALMSEAKKRGTDSFFLGSASGSSRFYDSSQLDIIFIQHNSAITKIGEGAYLSRYFSVQ